MRGRRIYAWALALGLGGSIAAVHPLRAVAQDQYRSWQDQDRDQDQNRDRDRDRDDRDNRNDRGRRRGQYADRDRDNDRDRDRDNDRVGNRGGYGYGQYGNGRYGNGRFGRGGQVGYQDGLNDGRNDRATGHSFRPTQDSNYRHADHGYSGMFGDKGSYQQSYRDAYMQGYQEGYGAQGGYPRR